MRSLLCGSKWVVGCIASCVVGCSQFHEVPLAADSGIPWDGSILEPSLDGSSDTGQQNDGDAQVGVDRDAGRSDAGDGSGQGTAVERLLNLPWRPLSWAPAHCDAQVATDVSTLIPWFFAWEPFPANAPEGAPVPSSNASGCSFASSFSGGPHPAGGYEQYVRSLGGNHWEPKQFPGHILLIFDAQLVPKLVIRANASCQFKTATTGREPCYAVGGAIACGDIVDPAPVFPGSGWGVGELAVGEDLVAIGGGGFYQRRDPQAQLAFPENPEDRYTLKRLAVHGPTLLSIGEETVNGRTRRRLVRSDHGGEWEVLRRFGRDVLDMAADETQIAWVEVDSLAGDEPRRGTLFAALWPAPGAPLVPTRVRELDDVQTELLWDQSAFTLRHGYLAHAARPGARLYRMSDGARWDVPVPWVHPTVLQPIWLDDTYVTYVLSPTGEAPSLLVRCPIADVLSVAPSE